MMEKSNVLYLRLPTFIVASNHVKGNAQVQIVRKTSQPEIRIMYSIRHTQGDTLGAVCVQGLDDSRWVQIALVFAIRYALHRRENRVIRC